MVAVVPHTTVMTKVTRVKYPRDDPPSRIGFVVGVSLIAKGLLNPSASLE
jgi:hypothetical protein